MTDEKNAGDKGEKRAKRSKKLNYRSEKMSADEFVSGIDTRE